MRIDDDKPMHVDRCDCGMINPQAKRTYALRPSVLAARVLKTADLRQRIGDLSP